MKSPALPAVSQLVVSAVVAFAAEPIVEVRVFPDKARVSWTLPPGDAANALTARRSRLESSTDLEIWTPEGTEVSSATGGPSQTAVDIAAPGLQRFFRVGVSDTPIYLAKGGAEVFGYSTSLAEHLSLNHQVTPAGLAAEFAGTPGLAGVSFDVSTAEYFAEWNADPAVWNASHPPEEARLFDFRLNAAAHQMLAANGFVVSEPQGSPTFADIYYRVWTDDLPVFVSSDSILHAWHRTWITVLEEIEEFAMRPQLVPLMKDLRMRIVFTSVPTALNTARSDAASYINTANSLLDFLGDSSSQNSSFFDKAVNAGNAQSESIFGSTRTVDWSQFRPRSHYTNSSTLSAYFRGMMWLGTMDLRIDQRATDNSLRELGAAVLITLAIRDAGLMDRWKEIDRVIGTFVGHADSMSPPQLLEILESENLASTAAFTSPAVLETLLAAIQSGQAGVQDIVGHPIPAPISGSKLVLPRSFTIFGQRFTPDSWALGQMVFDNIWKENSDPAGLPVVSVPRRLPSALDINFAVLGNDTPAAHLAQRMTATGGVPFRDSLDFARELVSIRDVIDSQPPESWTGTVYLHQLGALRTLSAPMPPTVPEALRTEAWKWKTVQTQLAGWTELRHDNLLYAKQSYTPPVMCFYPAGYVEPRPAFYTAMKQLVDLAATTLATIPMTGVYAGRPNQNGQAQNPVDREVRMSQWLTHFGDMSLTLQSLAEIAGSEVNQIPFSPAQSDFMQSIVEGVHDTYYGARRYTGWYPKLHLRSAFAGNLDPHPSEMWDPLVTDIHTDAPDNLIGDPGALLYNATGNVALMLIAVDVGGEICLHGGPSFTYYEFTKPYGSTRLTDSSWRTQVRSLAQPAPPEWSASWLEPGPIAVPTSAK